MDDIKNLDDKGSSDNKQFNMVDNNEATPQLVAYCLSSVLKQYFECLLWMDTQPTLYH